MAQAAAAAPPADLPVAEEAVLQGKEDSYQGILVDPEGLPDNPQQFAARLQQSLQDWEAGGKRGIWLKLLLRQAGLVPAAAAAGFQFHSADKEYVMMTRWLGGGEDKLPPAASHQVGVGAFVLDAAQRRVLMVQEKNGPLRGQGVWKMPTGLVAAGEDVTTAAEREVLEETGVTARAAAVLALRQAHGFALGKSDFFVVVALRPEPGQDVLTPQADEIHDACWMPLEEYAANPFFASRPLLAKLTERCVAYAEGKYPGLRAESLHSSWPGRGPDLLMYGEDVTCQTGNSAAAAAGSEQAPKL